MLITRLSKPLCSSHLRLFMPQLTLTGDPRTKALSLSPQKPTTRIPTRHYASNYHRDRSPVDLRRLHHEAEDMAVTNKSRAKAQAEGKKVANGDVEEVKKQEHDDAHVDADDDPKGHPGTKKRSRSPQGGGVAGARDAKKHKNAYELKGKVATAEVAAKVDEDPPLDQLLRLLQQKHEKVEKGESVVYWMRLEDIRVEDNTALATAANKAEELEVPLIALTVLSPGDWKMHDRGPNKIDYVLRNLRWVKRKFDELNIPFHVLTLEKRLSIPRRLVEVVFPHLRAKHVYANIEYEVDELRRDIATVKKAREKGIEVVCVHDRLVVPPGKVLSKQGKPMSVYSPWQRAWAKVLEDEPELLEMSQIPSANDESIRKHEHFGKLFEATPIPDHVEGFELKDGEKIRECWPEGTDTAKELLDRFFHTKARKEQLQLVSPLREGAERDDKKSRLAVYTDGRNLVNGDHSSRLSPYLAAGVISGRMVINAAKQVNKRGKLESGRDTGTGMWVQEVAWRDFYNHVVATWPRVSMGRPFLEKFADVQWEVNEEHLQAWKDGKTGYPIVDATMRACKARGWMENRTRMIVASFLVKSLMLDWRLGERYFMETFVDGDMAANNGGWQWTASTGTDPQPYFRIFNTLTQSEKCDPNGDYIRYWVPELKNLKGKAIHDPYHNMPSSEFKKLGYPAPIVDHKQSRERALFRYKNVGEKEA